jgi:hypothetical protein
MTGAGAALVIVGYALRESLRRRVFLVVLVLTVGFLALYGVGTYFAFRDVNNFVPRTRTSSIRRRSPAPPCSASRCSRPSSWAPWWRSF